MTNHPTPKTPAMVRRLFGAVLVVHALALPSILAQPAPGAAPAAEGAPVQMEKMVVTGSLIPTAETVGPAPVEVMPTEAIQKVGSSDVLATLKKLTPVLAGNANTGQEVNNGGTGESYIAIRNLRTLVLLNGRRLGNSSFSNGALVDLNTIPLAAIERIEVLKDGASALYGSEAVGGVVNIITKRDYTGVDIGGRFGAATGEGTFNEVGVSLVSGNTTEHSSFTVAIQYYNRDPLLTTDRKIPSMSYEDLLAHNIAGSSYLSPSFPGKVEDATASGDGVPTRRWLLRSSPLLKGTPDYDPRWKSPYRIPGQSFSGNLAVGQYNAAYLAYQQANPELGLPETTPYARIAPDLFLNTTQFGTHSIQSQDRFNTYAGLTHDLFDKKMQIFADFLFANIDSQGALAPSPVVGLGRFQSNIDIPGANIYNPFAVDLGPGYPNGLPPGGARVRSRFVESGNRLFDAQTDYYHVVAGLKGEFEENWGYNLAYTYNRYDQVQFTRNAINGAALEQALAPNADPRYPGLSQLYDSVGPVPMYNMFAGTGYFGTPGVNDPRTIDAIRTTLYQSGRSEQWDMGGAIHGKLADLPGGEFEAAAGADAGQESLAIDFDGLTKMGKVPGLNANNPTSGRRDNWAVFFEGRIPITQPDMNIPALHRIDVTAAVRHESFDPGGDATVPKLGLRWQPVNDQFTLRGTYSQSFIAPTTYQLFGGKAVNVPVVALPDGTYQEYTANLSNPNLQAVHAENWGAGIVISPKAIEGLTVSIDYYHVKTKDDIFRLSPQVMVDDINANGSASPYSQYFYQADGTHITTTAPDQATDANWGGLDVPLANGAVQETDGLDITLNYRLPVGKAGTLTFFSGANVLFSYKYSDPIVGGPYNYNGMYTDAVNGIPGAQGTLPDFILNLGVTWEIPINKDALALTINSRYIPSVDDPGYTHPSVGLPDNTDFTVDGSVFKVESYYQIDMQLSYEFGKHSEEKRWFDGTRITVGCNNVTAHDPPLISSAFEDNTDKSTYDIVGRFVYFELAKKF